MSKSFDFRWGVPLLDNQPGFAKVYEFMLDHYAEILTRDEFLCIIHLARYHYNSERGESRPSLETIAGQMGYSHKNSAWRLVQSLEDKGMLTVTRRPGFTSIYNAAPFTMHMMALAGITTEGVTSQCDTSQCDGVSPPSVPEEEKDKEIKQVVEEEIDLGTFFEGHPNSIKNKPEAPTSTVYNPLVADPRQNPFVVGELARQLALPIDWVWGYSKKTDEKLLHAAQQLLADCKGDIDGILEALDDYCETDGDWARDNLDDPHGLATLVGRRYVKLLGQKQRQEAHHSDWAEAAELSQAMLEERSQAVEEKSEDDLWWERVLGVLELKMSKSTFDKCLRPSKLLGRTADSIKVGLPNAYVLDWVDNRLRRLIERTLDEFGISEVEFVVKEARANERDN